jgi:DNA repair protein RecN (Recombination protein N)
MLAIKRVLAERDPVETYVFDEVDAGIGGATGELVGRMIREVARDRQVLCITHLPQIAAYGEAHYTVEKSVKEGRTQSSLTRLEGADTRSKEVARMLSGHITTASLEHANELIARGVALANQPQPNKKTRKSA